MAGVRNENSQTVRIASSNTVFNPFCVRAEHSRYYISAKVLCFFLVMGILEKNEDSKPRRGIEEKVDERTMEKKRERRNSPWQL